MLIISLRISCIVVSIASVQCISLVGSPLNVFSLIPRLSIGCTCVIDIEKLGVGLYKRET